MIKVLVILPTIADVAGLLYTAGSCIVERWTQDWGYGAMLVNAIHQALDWPIQLFRLFG